MFSEQELDARIKAANDAFVTGDEIPNAPQDPNAKPSETRKIGSGEEPWIPVDLYQRDETRRIENAKKKFPNGSSKLVKATVAAIIDGDGVPMAGLAYARKRAEDDSESLMKRGEKQRANIVIQQYMQEKFLPAVEAVIEYTSPDELLNSKEALDILDKMALGLGSMSGYTASYVRQAYGNQLGQKEGASDPAVRDAVRKIVMLSNNDEISTAIGMAKKMKRQIDEGEHIASDDDYALIGRVVAYAN